MRVLHVIAEMGVGGAESLVTEMVAREDTVGWESGVASGGGERATALERRGVPTFFVPPARRSLRGLLAARRGTAGAVRAFRPDVVLAHNVSATVVTWAARPGVPVLTVFHGVDAGDYAVSARIFDRTTDQVVAVSEAIAARLRTAGLRRAPLRVIRNAVTTPGAENRSRARASLGLAESTPVALCLARMEPQKRHDLLLDAWAMVDPPAQLLLAGDGSLRGELERRAAIGDRIRFLGSRTDVPALLAAADVTVLASDWEGLPMAVLESMAAAVPVVATDVDGLNELLGDGGGRLVCRGDAAGLAAALTELLGDARLREAEGARARLTIENRYDPISMMKSYDELLRGLRGEGENR